jgi:hypothetical protein
MTRPCRVVQRISWCLGMLILLKRLTDRRRDGFYNSQRSLCRQVARATDSRTDSPFDMLLSVSLVAALNDVGAFVEIGNVSQIPVDLSLTIEPAAVSLVCIAGVPTTTRRRTESRLGRGRMFSTETLEAQWVTSLGSAKTALPPTSPDEPYTRPIPVPLTRCISRVE